jgi:hypothetical protein
MRSHLELLCINDLSTTTNFQQWPVFLGFKGGRCTPVWLFTFRFPDFFTLLKRYKLQKNPLSVYRIRHFTWSLHLPFNSLFFKFNPKVTFLTTKDEATGGIKKLPNLSDIFVAFSTIPNQVRLFLSSNRNSKQLNISVFRLEM